MSRRLQRGSGRGQTGANSKQMKRDEMVPCHEPGGREVKRFVKHQHIFLEQSVTFTVTSYILITRDNSWYGAKSSRTNFQNISVTHWPFVFESEAGWREALTLVNG